MADDDIKDDLRGDVLAAMTELETGVAPEREQAAETPAVEQPQERQPSERARDETGRFAKTEGEKRETLTLNTKEGVEPEAKQPTAVANPQAQPQQQAATERIAPPVAWKGEGKVQWDRLPKAVQGELRASYEALETERAEVAPLKEMLDANRTTLVREAGSVQEGVRQLLAFHQLSLEKPAELIQHIARSRGLDLQRLFGGQPGQPGIPAQPENIQSYVEQLVQQRLQPLLAQTEQRETQQVNQTVEAFRADPKHPYFEDVRAHMSQLLRAGTAKDLPEAYDQAIWASPTIRPQLLAAQAEEAKRNQAAEVDRARKAGAASLRGSPLPGASANGSGNPNATVHDDVRAAIAELAG